MRQLLKIMREKLKTELFILNTDEILGNSIVTSHIHLCLDGLKVV